MARILEDGSVVTVGQLKGGEVFKDSNGNTLSFSASGNLYTATVSYSDGRTETFRGDSNPDSENVVIRRKVQ